MEPPPADPSIFFYESPNAVLGLTFSSLAACSLCVFGRLYTRCFVTRLLGWDDALVFVGFLCALLLSISTYFLVQHGLGQHMKDVPLSHLPGYFKISYICLATYPLAAGFMKVAILLQLRRLMERQSRAAMVTVLAIAMVILWTIAFGFVSWVPCFPVKKVWDASVPGHCYGLGAGLSDLQAYLDALLATAISNMLLDLLILSIAASMMWTQGTTTALRWRLFCLLSIGIIVNFFAAVRVVYTVKIMEYLDQGLTGDATFQQTLGITLMVLETNLAAICASVPTFWRPLKDAIRGHLGRIWVTKEVSVVRTRREGPPLRAMEDGHGEDGSRTPSMLTDDGVELLATLTTKTPHYEDEFIRSHVDPMKMDKLGNTAVSTHH